MDSIKFICPVCGQKLTVIEKSHICPNGHCFDIAKSGYVNLLPPSGSGRHGDDKLMVRSRTQFLDGGFYAPLAESITKLAAELLPDNAVVVDAGCGEGYYTAMLEKTVCAEIIGVDISKDALIAASKRSRTIKLCAASTAALPLEPGCADMVLNIFSPLFEAEFARVLKCGGHLIRVVPKQRHLWELKALVYDEPYENPAPETKLDGFRLLAEHEVKYRITLPDTESIKQLFMMTPYYYKTSADDQRKLECVECLETQLEFDVIVYERL